MPAEAGRLQLPLGNRDRWLWRAVAAIAAAAAIGLLTARPDAARPAQPAVCVTATVAGVMGAGTVHGCGPQADRLCRLYQGHVPAVAAQCVARDRRRSDRMAG